MRTRMLVLGMAIVCFAAACGNSGSSKPVTSKLPAGSTGITEVSGADLTKNDPISGQPGVTSTEIRVAVVTSATNILQGQYGDLADGIQAYFNYINSTGGLYGRKFKIAANRDDKMFQNEQVVQQSLSQDHAFATFIATPQFTSAPDLVAANQPTFIWNINPEMDGHANIFGTVGALCNPCIGQGLPFLAQQEHFTKVAVLGYGVNASSKDCGAAIVNSFKKYPSAQVVFQDTNLQFAQADLSSDVAQMAAKGAQFVMTCIDQKEALVLGAEIAKQHAHIVQNLPNGYDQQFIKDNAAILEGSFLETQFVPFEQQPELPEQALIKQWVAAENKPLRELTIEGWIAALEFVHGLKLAGPDFTQQKLIDSLNQDTHFDAHGLIVPIDWTKQHNDPKGHPEFEGPYDCATALKVHDGKFVTFGDNPPGKPWTCMVGGSQGRAPTLTKTPEYMSFPTNE